MRNYRSRSNAPWVYAKDVRFNYVMDDILSSPLNEWADLGFKSLPVDKLNYLEYDIAKLGDNIQVVQHILNRLQVEVQQYGLQFESNKRKVRIHDW